MKIFSVLVVVGAILFVSLVQIGDCVTEKDIEKELTIIQDHLSTYKQLSGPLCEEHRCCNITSNQNDDDGCSFQNMPEGESTLVLPGGKTQCIFGSPYGFQVIPGDRNRVVVYFQGGGACWDKWSTDQGLCLFDAEPATARDLVGMFDRTQNSNKFRHYTIIHLLYCSGDLFAGNAIRDYSNEAGEPAVQVGYWNVRATLDWIKAQQSSGALAETFDDLLISGCSAGAVSVQFWAVHMLEELRYHRAAVLPDSYIGYFPPNSQGPLFRNYGVCDTPLIHSQYKDDCYNGKLDLLTVNLDYWPQHPNVPYAFIQSKADGTQRSFYSAVALTNGNNPLITAASFYKGSLESVMAPLNAIPNFLIYLVDGNTHCFTPRPEYYTTWPSNPPVSGAPSLEDWCNELPAHPHLNIQSVCSGQVVANPNIFTDPTYCYPPVVPKNWTQPQ